MGSQSQKKLRVSEGSDADIISRLPDEMIHKILSFLDAKEAIQTSTLSRRWKPVWTTLPYLNFGKFEHSTHQFSKLIRNIMSKRNNQSKLLEMELCLSKGLPGRLGAKFIEYTILHKVEHLNLDLNYKNRRPYKLSILSSTSLKTLILLVKIDKFDGWNFPNLTTLHLKGTKIMASKHMPNRLPGIWKLPESCFTCLPALRTLCLDDWDFSTSYFPCSMPHLTTLRLYKCCGFPKMPWNFPSLLTLELDDVHLSYNVNSILSTLLNLQNLTLHLNGGCWRHNISSPQLLNLNIRTRSYGTLLYDTRFGVLAPNLRNFTSVGIFTIKFEVAPDLRMVNLKLKDWFGYLSGVYRKIYFRGFKDMLSEFVHAKVLKFDLDCIELLCEVSDFLENIPSPFHNLKYVKLPPTYKESSIPRALRNYLLGGCTGASIVTTFGESIISQTIAPSITAQESLATQTKELQDSQFVKATPRFETGNMKL